MTSSDANAQDVPKQLLIDADYLIYGVGFASEEDSEKFAKSRLVETLEDLVYIHLKADSYEAFLTGKNNYTFFAGSLGIDLDECSEYLQTFEGAVQSACFFWEQNNLNKEADAGDIKTMTRKINGGYIGLEDRIKHYEHALHIFGAH